MATPPNGKDRPLRSFWFDPRFAIGLILVLVSVGGVLVLVNSADDTVTVYSAREPLTAGDRITPADLVEQPVRLGTATDNYLTKASFPTEGLIVTKSIAAGELVPTSAVGNPAGVRVASVVISVSGTLPKAVAAGTVVDVWAAQFADNRTFGPPAVLVPAATVVRVVESDSMVSGGAFSVELLVARARTARILQAIANTDALSLVPVNLPADLKSRG